MPKGKATPKTRPEFLDVAGAAELLNVSERWIRRQVYEQRIPYHKFNRRIRFKVDDLLAYAELNRKEARW